MKKTIAISLIFILSCFAIGINRFSNFNYFTPNTVYAYSGDNDHDGFKDEEDPYPSPDQIIIDMFNYYGITPTEYDKDNFLYGYINNSNDPNATYYENAYFEIQLFSPFDPLKGNIYILDESNNMNGEDYCYDLTDSIIDSDFSGDILLNEDKVNVFDLETDYIATETYNNARFALGLSIIAARVIKFAVIATAVIVCATYPEYIAQGLKSLSETIQTGTSIIFEKVRYYLTLLTESCIEIIKSNYESNSNKIYYIAVPINKHTRIEFPGYNIGDMLIFTHPVTLNVAKIFLNASFSIYTYYANNVEDALIYTWPSDLIVDEVCNFKPGYYHHYHSYHDVNGEQIKRGGYYHKAKMIVHGFYGVAA